MRSSENPKEIQAHLTEAAVCIVETCQEKVAGVAAYLPRFGNGSPIMMTVCHCANPNHKPAAQNTVAQVAKMFHMMRTGDQTAGFSPN